MPTPVRTAPASRRGCLYLIGGAEGRGEHKQVLSRLVEIAGGGRARIVLLTAASQHQAEARQAYEQAFAALGVKRCHAARVERREDADDPQQAQALTQADVVFISGGDQRRLMALVGGTRMEQAIHLALRERGACIAGTSAGAAAMSQQMLSDGDHAEDGPQERPLAPAGARLSPGLGLLQRLVIDQHFTQRQRLARLEAVVGQCPELLGVGIDEDTALHIQPGHGIEVVGSGTVTLVDGRKTGAQRLHCLPAGLHCRLVEGRVQAPGPGWPPALSALVAQVANAPTSLAA